MPAKVTICEPMVVDSLSTCQHLLSHLSLQLYIWIVASLIFIGNLSAIYSHWKSSHNGLKQISHLLLLNLAIADFLMSIYLFIIAIANQYYRNHYGTYAESWLRSAACSLAFFFGSLSSFMSVMMMLLISVDLCLRVSDPFRYRSGNHIFKRFKIVIITFWLLYSLYIGIPAITSYNTSSSHRIYKHSSICMPSNVHNIYLKGWILATTFITVSIWLAICILFFLVFLKAYQSRTSVRRSLISSDRKLVRKLSLILLTDLISWLPYFFIMFKAIATNAIDIFELKFVIIFALPINSALNPFLYRCNLFFTIYPCLGSGHEWPKTVKRRHTGLASTNPVANSNRSCAVGHDCSVEITVKSSDSNIESINCSSRIGTLNRKYENIRQLESLSTRKNNHDNFITLVSSV